MTWTLQMLRFKPFIRSRFFLAGSLAFFFSLSPASADLNQQDEDRIFNAILTALDLYSSWAPGYALQTHPEDDTGAGIFSYLVANGDTVADLLSQILAASSSSDSSTLTNLLYYIRNMSTDLWELNLQSHIIEGDLSTLLAPKVSSLDENVSNILYSWDEKFYNRATFSGNEDLLVHDNMLFEMMQSWYDDDSDHWDDLSDYYNDIQSVYLDNIETAVENMVDSGLGLTFALSNLVELTQRIYLQLHPVSNDVENIVEDAEQEVQQDMRQGDRDIQDFLDEFEPEYLDDEDNYPDQEEQHIANDRTGISGVTNPNNHGTTILFTAGTTGGIPLVPRMEWDMLRNSSFSSFVDRVTTVCHAGWTAFFSVLGFMLYYTAYRRARSMLEASHASVFQPADYANAPPQIIE